MPSRRPAPDRSSTPASSVTVWLLTPACTASEPFTLPDTSDSAAAWAEVAPNVASRVASKVLVMFMFVFMLACSIQEGGGQFLTMRFCGPGATPPGWASK